MTSRHLTFALLAALILPSLARAQTPASTPTAANKMPPFLKVDGIYLLDGREEDMVRVLEVSDTGWIRVSTRAGESWVNVSNLTTITPVSKDSLTKTELHQKADFILAGAQAISDAIDAYASKNNLPPDAPVKWADIRKFLKSGTTIYESAGKDLNGRPYIFGTKIEDHVKVNPETVKEFAPVIDDPATYWGKFKP